jgi:hypothetical protein
MPPLHRLIARILSGTSDQKVRFEELRQLLLAFGFQERVRGSHHIFYRDGIEEILNLQPRDGGKAKPYQVRQVRLVMLKYRLAGEV